MAAALAGLAIRTAAPAALGCKEKGVHHEQNYLGHKNPSITLRVYSHAITSDQAHTVAAVDRMLGG